MNDIVEYIDILTAWLQGENINECDLFVEIFDKANARIKFVKKYKNLT